MANASQAQAAPPQGVGAHDGEAEGAGGERVSHLDRVVSEHHGSGLGEFGDHSSVLLIVESCLSRESIRGRQAPGAGEVGVDAVAEPLGSVGDHATVPGGRNTSIC